MKKTMATKNTVIRYNNNIKELRDNERSFFIAIGCTIASVVLLGQLVAHLLT